MSAAGFGGCARVGKGANHDRSQMEKGGKNVTKKKGESQRKRDRGRNNIGPTAAKVATIKKAEPFWAVHASEWNLKKGSGG